MNKKELRKRLRRYECRHGVAYGNPCQGCAVPFPRKKALGPEYVVGTAISSSVLEYGPALKGRG